MDSDKNQGDPLSNLLEILFARKLSIVFGFLGVLVIAIVGAILMPPVYEAYTTIYVDAPTLPRLEVPYIEEMASKSFLRNQKEIIKSRLILDKVVSELKLDQIRNSPKTLNKWRYIINKWRDKIYQLLNASKPVPDATEKAIKDLSKRISVHLPRGTNIVTITAASNLPERSSLLANTIAKEYIQYANNLLFENAQSGYNFIEDQVEKARQGLFESEKALAEFKEQEMVISFEEENAINIKKLATAEEEFEEIQLQIANLGRQVYQIKKSSEKAKNEQITSQDQYQNLEDRALKDKLNTLKYELVEAKVNLTEEHPDLKALRNKIGLIEEGLKNARSISFDQTDSLTLQNLNLELIKLNEKKDHLANQIDTLLKRREKLTEKQFAFEKLARGFQNNQQTYRRLKAKLDNAGILQANEMKTGSIRVIDRAFPPPYSNKKKKIILLAIAVIIAIIFSLGMAFIAEYLDNSLKTPGEVERYLNLPVLGAIPSITRKLQNT